MGCFREEELAMMGFEEREDGVLVENWGRERRR